MVHKLSRTYEILTKTSVKLSKPLTKRNDSEMQQSPVILAFYIQ